MKEEVKKLIKNSWIDWIQLLLIGLAAPFFLFPSMKFVWILLILPGIWICRWIVKKQPFERTALDWAVIILLIQVFTTCIIVPDLSFSLPKIAGVLLGVAFFYSIVTLLISEKLIKWGIISFLGAGLLLSTISVLGIRWDREIYFVKMISNLKEIIPKIKWNLPGAEEGFNSNAIGGILILIIPLSLLFFLSYLKRKKENYLTPYGLLHFIFFIIILFVFSILLFFTMSISSWIGLIISIWILLLSWKWKKWSLVLILLIVTFIFLLSPAKITQSINMIKKDIAGRETLWSVGVSTINQNPLFGIGMNRIRQIPSVGYTHAHAHNHLVHTAAELGIPGLIAYLSILIAAGYMCFTIWRKSDIGWMRISALGLGCGQFAHLIFGMADSIPLGAKVGIFFWFSLGLITAIYNYVLNRNSDSSKG